MSVGGEGDAAADAAAAAPDPDGAKVADEPEDAAEERAAKPPAKDDPENPYECCPTPYGNPWDRENRMSSDEETWVSGAPEGHYMVPIEDPKANKEP